ncbi:MAG: vWA domain-containing protein [Actinomycetota bacterium]
MAHRRIGWSIAAVTAAFVLSPGVAAALSGAEAPLGPTQVVSTNVGDFPSVLVTLSVPGTKDLKVDDVLLTENGTQMQQGGRHGVIVKSLAVSNGEYQSVVLAIDNSKDVSASELKAMLGAAHDFISTVPNTVPFGVVTLASKPQVLQKAVFHDQPEARRALESIKASSAPASLGDGLDAAVKGAIAPRGQRNIVVFSGGSTAAQSISSSTSKRVEGSTARVSAIVVDGKPGSDLSSLSSSTGGTVEAAAPGTLSQVNNALAHRIGDQFLLSYQSHAGPGEKLDLSIKVNGETLHTSATVPSGAPPGVTPSPKTGVFSGTRGYLLIIVIIVALLVLTSVPGRLRERRRRRAGGGRSGDGGGGGRRQRRRGERDRERQKG